MDAQAVINALRDRARQAGDWMQERYGTGLPRTEGANTRNAYLRAGLRGFFDMDAPEDMTAGQRDVYENARRAGAPAMGLAAAPIAVVKGAKAAKRGLDSAPQTEALETARQNAVKMLGLPENNTAMDRAKAMGYVDDIHGKSYRGNHQAPLSVDDVGAPAHALNRVYPDDVYSSQAYRYYGHGADSAQDANLVRRLQALRNRPDADVPIYRAVPKNAPEGINHGDWVTPDRQYAKDHGESVLQGDYKILYDRAPAKSLFTDGNSIYEFGYDKSQKFAQGPASIPIVRSSNPANRERSRFAAFDPAKAGERDLLGRADPRLLAALAAGTGAGAATIAALRNRKKEDEEQTEP